MMEVAPVVSNATSTSNFGADGSEWQFLQCFGERAPGEDIQEADIISAVDFDLDGGHLATGDRGGRVVLFEQLSSTQRTPGMDERILPGVQGKLQALEYRYLTEFQSHEPEFDYLKSLEIEEKINKVQWVNHIAASQLILSTNDKTVKLWKVYEKEVTSLAEFNVREAWSIPAAGAAANVTITPSKASKLAAKTEEKLQIPLRFPKIVDRKVHKLARCSRVYANAHTYHINSISMSSDQETFLSADDLRINLWHLDVSSCSFNIVDMKPANMEDLTEVITCAEFHPHSCHTFAYSSSRGGIKMGDLRASALCDHHTKAFEAQEPPSQRSFFSEIISSISDMKFSRDGRHLLSRDLMSLKLWDVNMEAKPVAVYPVHEHLRPKLTELYENDSIFDKFNSCMSAGGDQLATGTYNNSLRIVKHNGNWANRTELQLDASRDPLRKRQLQPKVSSRFGLSRNSGKRAAGSGHLLAGQDQDVPVDFSSKLLHLAWHPSDDIIAVAASNSLYMYAKR